MKDKIIEMRVHQAVKFEKSLVTYFTTEGGPGRASASMEILPELSCVLVNGPTDRALVPLVNIAFLKLESISSKAKSAAKKTEAEKVKSTLKASDIKKPK